MSFNQHNKRDPDRWETDYYLEQLEESLEAGTCWIRKGSIMAVNKDRLIFSKWEGDSLADFLFLMDVWEKCEDLRVVPLGNYFHDLGFLMNRVSLRKFHACQVDCIRLDMTKHNQANIREYLK